MGYSTYFFGDLLFTETSMTSAEELVLLNSILGCDARDMPHWKSFGSSDLTHMDLKLNKTGTGIQWSGDEKTYDLPQKVSLLIRIMRTQNKKFGLSGFMEARGESPEDTWSFEVNDNVILTKDSDDNVMEKISI